MRRKALWLGAVRFMFVALLMFGAVSQVSAQRGKQQKKDISSMTVEEKRAYMLELEMEKRKQDSIRAITIRDAGPTGADLNAIIARYEKLLEPCQARKGDRCADVMYTLGSLYYDQARDEFGKASERYADAFKAWERTGRGTAPTPPIPDYSKSLQMYWQLTREYPNFPKLPEAFFQMANNYLLSGHLDTTRMIFEQLVQRFPRSPRVSAAQFRLGELAFMDNNYRKAYEHFRAVKQNEVDPITREMVHYRLGECAYYVGDYDQAVDYFHGYIVECDANRYPKKEFRDMAIEYMIISFSEMPNGVQEAIKFFNKNKGKPYEAQVIYGVGRKNRERAQWDAAILALEGALKSYPMYKDAPLARQMLIESYVAKKEHQKANSERESLVDDYGEGSKWFAANSKERVVIDQANASVRRALGDIAIFYHGEAQRRKDRSLYEKAMTRYNEFFRRFPNDKWRVYEYNYNVAEIYSSMGNCEKAADHYNFVAMQDLSTYPAYVSDVDTLGMDPEVLEQMKAQAGDKTNPIQISQEDAGFNTIVALDNCRKRDMARDDLSEEKAYALPTTKRLIEQAINFQKRFPKSANAPEVLYLAGNIHFTGKSFNDAITMFKQVIDEYPDAKIAPNAMRQLGNSYSSNNQFDLAMQTFDNLLRRTPEGTKEHEEIRDLAAGAMYRAAEHMKKGGDLAGAANAFKAIAGRFAESQIAYRGWFEAGVCYEEMKNLDLAAQTFEELTERFPRSSLRESAYIRAAENYKKAENWSKAAQVYFNAANAIPKAEFAIPSLSSASEMYQKMEDFNMAGQMFTLIFEKYKDDPKTPQALYNAGLIFEKGKHYHDAIKVYDLLAKNYPNSEFAGEAFFSIGLCWEKLEEFGNMANSFADYAKKYPGDRFKQVQALVKAGNAFFNMENFKDAEINYNQAIKVYEQHSKTSDIDAANVAEAYYRMGEMRYQTFNAIKLEARNAREMATRVETKMKAAQEPGKYFMQAVELGVEEWTMRALYMVGRVFYDMAEAVANQTLFGNKDEQVAGKIQVLQTLDPLYKRAMDLFGQNIAWAKEQNLSGEYVDMSMQGFMEMAFKSAHVLEEVGLTFKNAPVHGNDDDEREMYQLELEERYLAALDAAMPKYEWVLQTAQEIGIAEGEWIEKTKERLRELNPESEALNLKLVQWKPTEKKEYDEHGNEIVARARDPEYERNLRRIQDIMGRAIPVEDKISQLNRIKMEAERAIIMERERISELKEKAGT